MSAVKVHGWVAVTQDFELMMISALRYAIGRQTYMPSVTIDYIHYLIPQLSPNTLFVMKRDISEEIGRHNRLHEENPQYFGKMYMAEEWKKLAEDISAEYEKKKVTTGGC